jgi:hypothetical protein
MMNVLLIVNILLVVSYVGITIGRMKALPESISAMVYELPKGRQWVWSVWLCLVSFTLMPVLLEKLPDNAEFLGFLTVLGLAGAAVTPLIHADTRKWHYVVAVGAGILSQVCTAILSPWWLVLWLIMLGLQYILENYSDSKAAKALYGKQVFIAECICYMILILGIAF